MKDTPSTQDLIQISSYLDDRLSPDLKARVETRAGRDPLFRSTIDEMAYARNLLRSLPQRRAPRNFTLSQKYAPEPRRLIFRPVFAFTSVIATAITFVILAGSVLFPTLLNARSAAPASQETAPLASLGTQDSSRNSSEPTAIPPLILWNGAPYGGALGMGGGGGDGTAPGIGGGAGGSGQIIGGGSLPTPESTPESTPTEAPLTTMAQPSENPNDLILGIAPKDLQGQELTPQADVAAAKSPEVQPSPQLTTSNILEIVFGSIAVLAAALALIFRKRS